MTAKQEPLDQPELLRPVQQRKVSAVVAQRIIELIESGSLPVGARLPSEKELADRMGVSRPSVREALAALEAVGVVDARPGRGSFVRRIPSEDDGTEPLTLLETEECCREIIETRGALEPPAAALAAQARNDDDLKQLQSIHEYMEQLARPEDFDAYIVHDMAYHRTLIEATHNNLLIQVLVPLISTMEQKVYREFTRNHYVNSVRAWRRVVEVHAQVLEAVFERDSARAARMMKAHWHRMKRVYEA